MEESQNRQLQRPALILALETATAVSSVALFEQDRLLGSYEFHTDKLHAKLLNVMVSRILADLDLQPRDLAAVGMSAGPGSYTGLRVGVSVAKGLCMALDIPLLALNSIEALAWSVQDIAEASGAWICPLIDARRMEVFCALYDAQVQAQSPIEAKVMDENAFAEVLARRKVLFVGDGAEKCRHLFAEQPNAIVLGQRTSTASAMGQGLWGRFQAQQIEDLTAFEPFYLKDFVATFSKKKYL